MYMYMNLQLYAHEEYLLCGFMVPHGIHFCILFVLDRSSLFLFLLEVYVPFLLKFIGCICLFSENPTHFHYFLGQFSRSLPLLQSLRTLPKPFNLQINKQSISTPSPEQITEIFNKLLVCTKPLCTKLMMGINIYYLHIQKDIHIYFFLILSLFYKYCTYSINNTTCFH